MNVAAGAWRRVASSRLRRAVRVDGEVRLRLRCRPVVGGLGCGVDHELQGRRVLSEHPVDRVRIADVERQRPEGVAQTALETLRRRRRRGRRAEEVRPHVVVQADHVVARLDEVLDGLRSDQPAGSGDDRCRHPAVRLASSGHRTAVRVPVRERARGRGSSRECPRGCLLPSGGGANPSATRVAGSPKCRAAHPPAGSRPTARSRPGCR